MEILFPNARLQKLCNSDKELRKKYGPRMVKRLQQRLKELRAADTLEDMRTLPGARCHELKGNLSGKLAVDLEHPNRLVFFPAGEAPRRPDGSLDWGQVTEIIIYGIGDYH
jgi:plasmid maintenance system killer protein